MYIALLDANIEQEYQRNLEKAAHAWKEHCRTLLVRYLESQ